MQPLFAIIGLTWKAAFRYRLFWVVGALLLCAVVGLPLLVKDDGTAQGFAQILITYTLGAVSGLLGICTLWLACGTLARDVEECQMQMVAVKPIPRWQIWIGKWLGIVLLNAALLTVAGLGIYGTLAYRERKLPPDELFKLQNEVLVARASVKEDSLQDNIEQETERVWNERLKKGKPENVDLRAARQQLREQVKAEFQLVAPGQIRPWVIHLGPARERLKDQPLYLRVKFNAAESVPKATYYASWAIGSENKTNPWKSSMMSMAPDTFHEFSVPPNLFDENGTLIIVFTNPNETALLFSLDEGLEVLYRVGSFGPNFVRGLSVILCWMALFAALGLASASLLSFPVAAFLSLGLLTMGLSSGTLSNVVSDGTIMGYDGENRTMGHSTVDNIVVPAFRGALKVINLVEEFSPIDSLSTGRTITWAQLGLAFGQIVLLLGGLLGLIGIFIFHRRELATAQGNH